MTRPQCATCYAMMAAIEALHPIWQEQDAFNRNWMRYQDAARRYECRDYMAAFA